MEEPTNLNDNPDTDSTDIDSTDIDNTDIDEGINQNDAPKTGAHFETPPPPPPPPPAAAAMPTQAARPRRLTRTSGPISGVAGGLADYFGVDPTLVRLGIVLTTILTGPAVPVAYVAAWIIVPEEAPVPAPPVMAPQTDFVQPAPPQQAPAPVEVA